MTTNQTIDGVPRKALADFIEYSVPGPYDQREKWEADKAELRALLDAPIPFPGYPPVPEDRKLPAAQPQGEPVALGVWYGPMPESNGKTNWTAILHRKDECWSEGITIDRSEYPDRVRYEADRMLHLIGVLKDAPDILAYDADKHSGYVKSEHPAPVAVVMPARIASDHLNEMAQGWNACIDAVTRLNDINQ